MTQPPLDHFFKSLPKDAKIVWGEPKLPVDPYEAALRAREAMQRAFEPTPLPHLRVMEQEIDLLAHRTKIPSHLLGRPIPTRRRRLRIRLQSLLRRLRIR